MNDSMALLDGFCVDGARLPLTWRELPAAQTLAGPVHVGTAELGRLGGLAVGVWEHTAGASTDVEVDEFFVVLSGEATVDFDDGSPSLRLRAGSVGRLFAGSATRWTVTRALRKIYIA